MVDALSVFAGGFTQEAGRAVCPDEPVDTLVPGLVARSVLVETGVPPRYRLGAKTRGRPDDVARRRHLDWARAYAEEGAAALDGPRQDIWLGALETEHDNFRAALQWGTARPESEEALALAAALGRFWEVRGYAGEGRRWLSRALAQNPGAPASVRARAANSAGLLALRDRDYRAARTLYDDSLTLHWELDDRLGASAVLHAMGNIAFQQGDRVEAQRLFEESLAIGRDLRDDRVVAASLTNLGAIAEVSGDHAAARTLYYEALGLWRVIGDQYNAAGVYGNLADVALAGGDIAGARHFAGEALDARRLVGDTSGMAAALRILAFTAQRQGDTDAARAFEEERRALSGEKDGGWMRRLKRRFGR
ncbi:MAG: tetratricopeptide repeat protein [Acidimicrobiales bacterium]